MKSLVFFLVTALFLLAPGMLLAAPDVAKIADLINEHRLKANLPALKIDSRLSTASNEKAREIARLGRLKHTASEGDEQWDITAQAGYKYGRIGENLIVGYASEEEIVRRWMNSKVHRDNILNPEFTDMGIGLATGEYKGRQTYYLAQLVASPYKSRVAEGDEREIRELKAIIANLLALVNEYTFKINKLYAK